VPWYAYDCGAIIFRDLVGKLDVPNVECDKCGRRGRYHVHRLVERYGIDAKLFDWSDADCPRKQARSLNDQCGARCPDLPTVV
jgi:predicted nucleic acid-binding Zn ribbon protein